MTQVHFKSLQKEDLLHFLIEKNYLQTNHASVFDRSFQKTLSEAPWKQWVDQPNFFDVRDKYILKFKSWIENNSLVEMSGLSSFSKVDLVHGTTQSFDEAYFRYRHRRLRLFRGEYSYHRRIHTDAVWVEDEPLTANDYLIVSLPFCGNGDLPPQLNAILDQCDELKIPVVLDAAWFSICSGAKINASRSCIQEVSFSLSKSTGTGRIRSGIRFSNYDDQLPIRQQNNHQHLPLGSAQVGLWMMDHFSSDWLVQKYKPHQEKLCKALDLKVSPCVHIALASGQEKWHSKFIIDGVYYKVGIREALMAMEKKSLSFDID